MIYSEILIKYTYQWLCQKFPDFYKVNLQSKTTLICGKPQAGKSDFTFGICLMQLLYKNPCVFIVRNYTQDAIHMKEKITRFSNQYISHINSLGFKDIQNMDIIQAGDMILSKENKLSNYTDILDVLSSKRFGIIISLANGTQLKCINMVLDMIEQTRSDIILDMDLDKVSDFKTNDLVILTDEADIIGYSEIKVPGPERHKAEQYSILINRANKHFEISATVWDILHGNQKLKNTNIVIIKPPTSYKGILDSIQFKILPEKIKKWTSEINITEEDPNITDVYNEIMSTPLYKSDMYNCPIDHPIIVLHKTRREVNHHIAFFDYFRKHNMYKHMWTVVMEYEKGITFYSYKLKNKKLDFPGFSLTDNDKTSTFYIGKKMIIPQLLQWFIQNGGSKMFPYIVIKSGQFSGRSRSYVSTDGSWHLTHQYYNGSNSIPDMIQAQRILHNRPDSIPLIEYAPKDVIKDIKKGDMIQDEQLERLLNLKNAIHTYIQIKQEKWSKYKVPRNKICVGKVNKAFKLKKSLKDDGWELNRYLDAIGEEIKTHIPLQKSKDEKSLFERVKIIWLEKKGQQLHKLIQLYIDNDFSSIDSSTIHSQGIKISNFTKWDINHNKYHIIEKVSKKSYILRASIVKYLNLL